MDTRRVAATLALSLTVALSLSAFAHGHTRHILGVVKATGDNSVTVMAVDNTEVAVLLDAKTKFERPGAGARPGDVAVGDRVVIHALKNPAGEGWVAQTVKIGATASADAGLHHLHHPGAVDGGPPAIARTDGGAAPPHHDGN